MLHTGQSYAPHTSHADAKRLEIRVSNLIEDICDVAPGRGAVSSSHGVYINKWLGQRRRRAYLGYGLLNGKVRSDLLDCWKQEGTEEEEEEEGGEWHVFGFVCSFRKR